MPKTFDECHVTSGTRITIFTNAGETQREFILYRETGFFASPHLTSRCERITVQRVKTELPCGETVTMPNQYRVFVGSKAVPDHQYTIRHSRRDSKARQTSRYKQTFGRDPG